jgi:3',5'-cyclic-AMP phosphodiesterase
MSRMRLFLLLLGVLFCLADGTSQAQGPQEILRQHDPTGEVIPESARRLPARLPSAPVALVASAPARPPIGSVRFGLAVMADLHTGKETLPALTRAVAAVNQLPGIAAVALLGDLCRNIATERELRLAARVVESFSDPVWAIVGNHDFMYQSEIGPDGKKRRGSAAQKKAKLEAFKNAMRQKELCFTRKVGGHLLVFLPIDALAAKPLAQLSGTTLTFFRKVLAENPKTPTIVFCHAPLEGSYESDRNMDPIHCNAQPAKTIRAILHDHPQVFLWLAGHLHIGPNSRDYHSKANEVDGVTVIHVPSPKGTSACVRVLDLTPAAAVVRTFDTKSGKYFAKFDRVFRHQKQSGADVASAGTKPAGSPPAPADFQDLLDKLAQVVSKLKAQVSRLLGLLQR